MSKDKKDSFGFIYGSPHFDTIRAFESIRNRDPEEPLLIIDTEKHFDRLKDFVEENKGGIRFSYDKEMIKHGIKDEIDFDNTLASQILEDATAGRVTVLPQFSDSKFNGKAMYRFNTPEKSMFVSLETSKEDIEESFEKILAHHQKNDFQRTFVDKEGRTRFYGRSTSGFSIDSHAIHSFPRNFGKTMFVQQKLKEYHEEQRLLKLMCKPPMDLIREAINGKKEQS